MRRFLIKVNGTQYEVDVEEVGAAGPVSQPLAGKNMTPVQAPTKTAAKTESAAPAGAVRVHSPMPGTVLKLNVKTGDVVKKGQVLLILEAMKMENEIVAPNDGKIAAVHVEKGASVNAGEDLISLM